MNQLEFFFDYNCVFCFLGRYTVKELQTKNNVEVIWRTWTMPNNANPKPKPDGYREGVKAYLTNASTTLGIDIQSVPSVDTFLALCGSKIAKEFEVEEAYHTNVFEGRFIHGLDISLREVIGEIAQLSGLNKNEFDEKLNDSKYSKQVRDDFQLAAERKIWTIPSFSTVQSEIQVNHYDEMPTAEQLKYLLR